jgi:hypothetical protein
MANPYYNTGANHADYSQGHTFHPNASAAAAGAATTTSAPNTGQQQQHIPVYSQSPYTVHPLPPSQTASYSTTADHSVLGYPPMQHHHHHPQDAPRWVGSDDDIMDYRQQPQQQQVDRGDEYEMEQQHLQSIQQQGPPPQAQSQQSQSHESQTLPTLQPHPPMSAIRTQPEQMSPSGRPGGTRTGTPRLV